MRWKDVLDVQYMRRVDDGFIVINGRVQDGKAAKHAYIERLYIIG